MPSNHLQFTYFQGQRIHLGVTGSIAAYKSLDLARSFIHAGLIVSSTLTRAAQKFITPLSMEALDVNPVYTEMFDSQERLYAHLEPGHNASLLLIAPITANTLAKLAHGLAFDLLSCQALAFTQPILVAPAMNPNLWQSPFTQDNVKKLISKNIGLINPDSGDVACGDYGQGRFPQISEIYLQALKALAPHDLDQKKVLVTLGPTREFWDPIRFWSNPSSGKMGQAIAVAAWMRGAEVSCVCGPTELNFPAGMSVFPVQTAEQMYEKCLQLWPQSDIACLAAAVADFKPIKTMETKFKKDTLTQETLGLNFSPNPDILKKLGQEKSSDQILIGFAAETSQNLQELAQKKLQKKNLDLIVANRIDPSGKIFGSSTNQVLILDQSGKVEKLPEMSKTDIAWRIWDWISKR